MLEAILTSKIPLFGRLEYINEGFGGVLAERYKIPGCPGDL
jgi:hypothetical protein